MNAPLSRRALLGATAAIGAVGLPVVALGFTPEPLAPDADATLRNLIGRHADLVVGWSGACLELDAARDRAEAAYPPRPTALTAIPFDLVHGLAPSGRCHKPEGQAWVSFDLDDLVRLRDARPVTSLAWDGEGRPLLHMPNLAGEAQRGEIVETYDCWVADCAGMDDRLGLTKAEAIEELLFVDMLAVGKAVVSYSPSTAAGMRLKARWALTQPDLNNVAIAALRQLAGESVPSDVGQAVSAFGATA